MNLLVPINRKYQHAWKQGLNLSSSLRLEVREEKLNLTPNILKIEINVPIGTTGPSFYSEHLSELSRNLSVGTFNFNRNRYAEPTILIGTPINVYPRVYSYVGSKG